MTEVAHGLRNVVLTETRLSTIDGLAGKLVIAGFPVEEIAPNATHEEVIYLLWHNRLPTASELDSFRKSLIDNRYLPDITVTVLQAAAARKLPIMDALRMGVDTLSLADTEPDDRSREANLRRGARLLARFPTIVAAYWRMIHNQQPIAPDPRLYHAANFLYMIEGKEADAAAVRGLETYLNTVIDHGMNNSTFTARVIASTRSDMVSAIVGAIGALKGPLHGGAPEPAMDMVFEIQGKAKKSGKRLEEEARNWVQARFSAKERIMGFGHRVYKTRDPRADVLAAAAEPLYEQTGNIQFYHDARIVESVILRELETYKPNANLKTNVEFYTALVLHGIGLESKIFTSIFATSRVGGWIGHVLEQYAEDELIRPSSGYNGEYNRKWTSLETRV